MGKKGKKSTKVKKGGKAAAPATFSQIPGHGSCTEVMVAYRRNCRSLAAEAHPALLRLADELESGELKVQPLTITVDNMSDRADRVFFANKADEGWDPLGAAKVSESDDGGEDDYDDSEDEPEEDEEQRGGRKKNLSNVFDSDDESGSEGEGGAPAAPAMMLSLGAGGFAGPRFSQRVVHPRTRVARRGLQALQEKRALFPGLAPLEGHHSFAGSFKAAPLSPPTTMSAPFLPLSPASPAQPLGSASKAKQRRKLRQQEQLLFAAAGGAAAVAPPSPLSSPMRGELPPLSPYAPMAGFTRPLLPQEETTPGGGSAAAGQEKVARGEVVITSGAHGVGGGEEDEEEEEEEDDDPEAREEAIRRAEAAAARAGIRLGPAGGRALTSALLGTNEAAPEVRAIRLEDPSAASAKDAPRRKPLPPPSSLLCPYTALGKLQLRGCRLGDFGVASVARILACDAVPLHTLDLSDNGFGASGAVALSDGLSCSRFLVALRVRWNRGLGCAGASALAGGGLARGELKLLDMSHCGVGARGCRTLGRALRAAAKLAPKGGRTGKKKGKKGKNGKRGAAAAEAAVLGAGSGDGPVPGAAWKLEQLDLRGNALGYDGIEALADGISSSRSLLALHLGSTGTSGRGSVVAVAVVSGSGVGVGSIAEGVRDSAGAQLEESMEVGPAASSVGVSGTWGMTEAESKMAAGALAQALRRAPALVHLDITGNMLSRSQAELLAQAVESREEEKRPMSTVVVDASLPGDLIKRLWRAPGGGGKKKGGKKKKKKKKK